MIRTGVLTAVERVPRRISTRLGAQRKRAGPALGWVMLLTLLMGSSVSAAGVLNPSFEQVTVTQLPLGRVLPNNWNPVDDKLYFNSACSNTWKTDGTWSATLMSLARRAVTPGRCQSFRQTSVDLTGIGTIKFDARLYVPDGSEFQHFEASFLVGGVPLWTQTLGGVHLDQEVNVAGMAGPHTIEIRLTALHQGPFGSTSYWAQWDNIRLIEGQLIIPAVVDLDPSTLNPASNGKWITCYIELGQDESGQPYDVSAIDGAMVKLNEVPAYLGDQGWATPLANAENVADFDGDGVLERMVKFDRAAVQALVQPPEEATVSIHGKLTNGKPTNGILTSGTPTNGVLFEGTAKIRVLDNKAKTQ